MTRNARYSVIFLFTLTLVMAGANLLFTTRAVHTSQHKWCTTLALLTSHPVPRPADTGANPSRENTYLFYVHLKTLERDFGCG